MTTLDLGEVRSLFFNPGMGHAMEIVLSGERINAEHAYRIGVVNCVYPQVAEAGLEALQTSDNWLTL